MREKIKDKGRLEHILSSIDISRGNTVNLKIVCIFAEKLRVIMEIGTINTIRQYFVTQPIKKAWLFGSCSRGEDTPDSDIDILVEYNDSSSISLMTISRIITALSKKLKRNIDLVEVGCLMPFAEKSVEKDKQLIYERKD